MRGRDVSYPCKNQELSVFFKGRTYAICSEEQMNYLLMQAQQTFVIESHQQKKVLSPEELKAKLTEYAENCGHATLDSILAKMTPEEARLWKDSYRFAPVVRPFPK